MKKLFIIIFLFGCQHAPDPKTTTVMIKAPVYKGEPDFISDAGVRVWTYGAPISKDNFDFATNLFAVCLGTYGIDYSVTFHAIAQTEVEWTKERIAVSDETTGAKGVKIGNHITVQWMGRLSNSSLFHEWLHSIMYLLVKTSDPDHTSSWWKTMLPDVQKMVEKEGL